MNRDLPIGIFDSGVGGLTVYRALHERLPSERFVYLGDTARVPYGTRSLETIERYSIENSRFLEKHGIKLLVIACNTASAVALPAIRKALDVNVVGMIEPGARAALAFSESETGNRTIGVIATEATAKSKAYSKEILKRDPGAIIVEKACPLFVPLAEEGWAATGVARSVAEVYLEDFSERRIKSLVLGCTHYPILRPVITDVLGDTMRLIDSGEAAALEVQELLQKDDLIRISDFNRGRDRELCDDLDHFYVTDAAERFARVAERFLGAAPSVLEAVEPWSYHELSSR